MRVVDVPGTAGYYSVTCSIEGHEFELSQPLSSAADATRVSEKVAAAERLLTQANDVNVGALLLLIRSADRPSKQQTMMAVAHLMALRSTCSRLRVGCVITDQAYTTVFSVGYNGNYAGGPNDCDSNTPGGCGCLHAEDNALVKLRTEQHGLRLFTTHSPCLTCAKRIINQGRVTHVWFASPYREEGGLKLLEHAGIETERL